MNTRPTPASQASKPIYISFDNLRLRTDFENCPYGTFTMSELKKMMQQEEMKK